MSGDGWALFRHDCIDAMFRFRRNEISMSDALAIVEHHPDAEAFAETRQFVIDIISEIDGFPTCFDEVLSMLRAGVSEGEFTAYMNRRS